LQNPNQIYLKYQKSKSHSPSILASEHSILEKTQREARGETERDLTTSLAPEEEKKRNRGEENIKTLTSTAKVSILGPRSQLEHALTVPMVINGVNYLLLSDCSPDENILIF
jgi:hypothetical protein